MAGEVQRKNGIITLPIKTEQVDVCMPVQEHSASNEMYCFRKFAPAMKAV